MLAFAVAAFGMTAPATVWDAHEISHIAKPVAIDEHHHHNGDVPEVSHGHDSEAPAQDGDGGHDHMSSLSATLSAILLDGSAAIFPALVGGSPSSLVVKMPADLIEPPPARPPRSV